MTLDTSIYVLGPIDPIELFTRAQAMLSAQQQATYIDRHDDGVWVLANEPGQGLPAWLMLYYRAGGPLATEERNAAARADHLAAGCEAWCDAVCNGSDDDQHPCYLRLSFDTTYGYRGPDGEDCNSLHARYIRELGAWLDERSVRWQWENEYTGEIFDRFDGLATLIHDGDQAQGWFENAVLPMFDKLGIITD